MKRPLKAYMKDNKLTVVDLAKRWKTPNITVYAWARGSATPSLRNALRIERLTRGDITVYDWV